MLRILLGFGLGMAIVGLILLTGFAHNTSYANFERMPTFEPTPCPILEMNEWHTTSECYGGD